MLLISEELPSVVIIQLPHIRWSVYFLNLCLASHAASICCSIYTAISWLCYIMVLLKNTSTIIWYCHIYSYLVCPLKTALLQICKHFSGSYICYHPKLILCTLCTVLFFYPLPLLFLVFQTKAVMNDQRQILTHVISSQKHTWTNGRNHSVSLIIFATHT